MTMPRINCTAYRCCKVGRGYDLLSDLGQMSMKDCIQLFQEQEGLAAPVSDLHHDSA